MHLKDRMRRPGRAWSNILVKREETQQRTSRVRTEARKTRRNGRSVNDDVWKDILARKNTHKGKLPKYSGEKKKGGEENLSAY